MTAGSVDVALVFALGTLRTLVAPANPESARPLAVAIELPIMLAASWFFCGFVICGFAVPPAARSRPLMGGVAFILLMLADFPIGAVMLGHSLGERLTLYKDGSSAIGLAAQVAFALMPWMYAVFERGPGTPARKGGGGLTSIVPADRLTQMPCDEPCRSGPQNTSHCTKPSPE